jgi:3-phosphoshikimate 1-carboxyvinyltransferase
VPSDPSAAAFFVAAALLLPGSRVTCKNILMDETRCGFYAALKLMGAKVEFLNQRQFNGEDVADICAEYTPTLKGTEIPVALIPSMIDECPIFMVVAAFATGTTKLTGLEELKVKESDRLGTMAQGLRRCAVSFDLGESEIAIHGIGNEKARKTYGTATPIKTQHDHRIAMSFLVMGSACAKGVVIDSGAAIKTSFPDFVPLMNAFGCSIKRLEE